MAQVIVSKGADHLPLHRLEGIFQRQGVRISRQTMDGWWLQTAEFLRPLVRLGRAAWCWLRTSAHRRHSGEGPRRLAEAEVHGPLLALRGRPAPPADGVRLHAPATSGTGRPHFSRTIAATCRPTPSTATTGSTWIRRPDHRGGLLGACAAEVPREPAAGPARMETALAWIGKLYAVEKELRAAAQGAVARSFRWRSRPRGSPPSGRSVRGRCWTASMPGWSRNRPRSCPRARFGRRWTTRSRTGRRCAATPSRAGWTSTTTTARTLCGHCLGRRNWLFCGSDRGGRAAASLQPAASCKRHGHDPFVYLRDVLTRLPAMLPGAGERSSRPASPPLAASLMPDRLGRRSLCCRVRPDAYPIWLSLRRVARQQSPTPFRQTQPVYRDEEGTAAKGTAQKGSEAILFGTRFGTQRTPAGWHWVLFWSACYMTAHRWGETPGRAKKGRQGLKYFHKLRPMLDRLH